MTSYGHVYLMELKEWVMELELVQCNMQHQLNMLKCYLSDTQLQLKQYQPTNKDTP